MCTWLSTVSLFSSSKKKKKPSYRSREKMSSSRKSTNWCKRETSWWMTQRWSG
jgi:hypothetical protein